VISLAALILTLSSAPPACVGLAGPPDLLDDVRVRLRVPTPCRRVEVSLARVDGAIEVAVDGDTRRVSTPSLAAAVVESWATPPAFGAVAPPPRPAPAVAPAASTALEDENEAVVGLSVRGEGGTSEGAATTAGLVVRGDVRVRDVFFWGAGRFTYTLEDPDWASLGSRTQSDFLVGVEYRVQVGAISIAPGVGGGFGVTHSTLGFQDVSLTSPGLVLHAGTRIAIPLGDTFALELAASASYLPLVDRPDLRVIDVSPVGFLRAVAPRWLARLGAGLRWGLF
jgi:hypothetical protein